MPNGKDGDMTVRNIFKTNRGVEIARILWPRLELVPEGSYWDKYGIDAHLDGETVQIKFDNRIALSGNIYHEIYEKSAYHHEQLWRKSPGIAENYIFTTELATSILGYLIKVDILAICETGKVLKTIYPNNGEATSMGFLIPVHTIECVKRQQPKGG